MTPREVASAVFTDRWRLYVRGLRVAHPPVLLSGPEVIGDCYVLTYATENDPIPASYPGWDADGSPCWEFGQ